jgi:hypothetical protein
MGFNQAKPTNHPSSQPQNSGKGCKEGGSQMKSNSRHFEKKSQQPNLRISFAIINFQNFYLLFFSLILYLLFRFWRKSFFLFYFRMQKPGLDEREYLMRITKFWILNFFQFYFWTLAKKASRKTGGKIINY